MAKRYLLILAVLLLAVCMFTGCGDKAENAAVLIGEVTLLEENTAVMTVASADPKECFVSSAQFVIPADLQLEVGDDLIVTFSGESTKDIPAQLIGVTEIQKITE